MQQHRRFRCILPVLVVSFFELEDPLDAAYRVIFSFFFCHKGNASVIVCVHCTTRVNGAKERELTRRRKKQIGGKAGWCVGEASINYVKRDCLLNQHEEHWISCKVFFVEWMKRWPNRVTNGSTKQKLKQRGNLFGKSTFNEDTTMVILDFEEITSICSFSTEAISQLTRFCGSSREKMSLNFV